PVMCRIRQRLTAHGGETIDAPLAWAKWHSSTEKEHREQDNAVYARPSNGKKTEKIGGIRI
ncbi:MAG TPA: hypothetical protein VEX64_00945, partial [Pyrinomonadaceae bacterium]|nr:hypothetical protein [Pyrinomonadaceae bacterium]